MTTIAVCITPSKVVIASGGAVEGINSKPHTTWATGSGESFFSWRWRMGCLSRKSVLGARPAAKNHFAGGQPARLEFGWKRVRPAFKEELGGARLGGGGGPLVWGAFFAARRELPEFAGLSRGLK